MMTKMDRLLNQLNPAEMYLVERWKKKVKGDDDVHDADIEQQAASLAISICYFYRRKALKVLGRNGREISIWNNQRRDKWEKDGIINNSVRFIPLFEKGDFDTVYDFETQYKR